MIDQIPGAERVADDRSCQPTEHRVEANGIELAYFEWGRAHRAAGPTLLLVHATGFHARCWDPVVSRLGDQHVIALDLRGHGRSGKTEITHWKAFGEDLAAFVRALELTEILGVGHSMGGHALVDAVAQESSRFRRLVLIDPVIASPDAYGEGGWTLPTPEDQPHPTVKRKRHFESAEAMIERFKDRVPYSVFAPEALRAYCVHGLLPDLGRGGFELACPPEIEASIYTTSRTNAGIYESIASIDLPVLILRARLPPEDRGAMDFSSSPTWPGLKDEFRNAREIHFADHTHFLPMELPERIADLISRELASMDSDR